MRHSPIRSRSGGPMRATAAVLVALAFLVAPAIHAEPPALSAQAAPVYGLSVTPLIWTVRDDNGGERKIEGLVVRGVSLRANAEGPVRPLRMVLMPIGRPGRNGDAGELKYELVVSRTPSGECVGIELHAGAALVDLAPPARPGTPIVAESLDLGRATPDGQSGGSSPRDVRLGFFPFWPMIITRSVVAGAEGTRLLIVKPATGEHADATTLASLVEGDSAAIDWNDNPDQGVRLRPNERVCIITTSGDRNRSAPANERQERLMSQAHEALKAGWAAAFADERR